jgi:hypothetical protein
MWRGVVKGGWNPHDREIPLRIRFPEIGVGILEEMLKNKLE